MTTTIHRRIGTVAILLWLPVLAAAQEAPAAQSKDESVPKLELAADPAMARGKVGIVHGTVGVEGMRCMIGGLSILQPVSVMLIASNESDDLTLSLFKSGWDKPNRTGSTRGAAISQFVFRTEGGVNILVRGASQPAPYALVVWAGEEGRPHLHDVVVTYGEFKRSNPAAAKDKAAADRSSSGMPIAMWIVIGVVGGGAAAFVLARSFGRRKQS